MLSIFWARDNEAVKKAAKSKIVFNFFFLFDEKAIIKVR
jgi:hypothetical protein